MKSYYSDAQFAEVLGTFRPAPGFDKAKFREQLERVAWFYYEWKADPDELQTDAQRRDFIRTLGAAAKSLRVKMREADASNCISKAFRQIGADTIYLRLQRLQKALEWFGNVSDHAAAAIESDIKKGGNRPDEPLRELILSVTDLYQQAAENFQKPTGWQADNKRGELLQLLQAVLRPVGVEMSLPALRQAYLRALNSNSPGRA